MAYYDRNRYSWKFAISGGTVSTPSENTDHSNGLPEPSVASALGSELGSRRNINNGIMHELSVAATSIEQASKAKARHAFMPLRRHLATLQ